MVKSFFSSFSNEQSLDESDESGSDSNAKRHVCSSFKNEEKDEEEAQNSPLQPNIEAHPEPFTTYKPRIPITTPIETLHLIAEQELASPNQGSSLVKVSRIPSH